MTALGRHFYGRYGLTKSPWGLRTMDFEGREIWSIGTAQASEKLSFCGFTAEELLDHDHKQTVATNLTLEPVP
jgi:hypothetical protein